jgi:hypothetical protein
MTKYPWTGLTSKPIFLKLTIKNYSDNANLKVDL